MEPHQPVPPRKHRVRRVLVRIALGLAMAFVLEYLVLPQLAGAGKALSLVSHVNVLMVIVGVAFEAASLTSYAQLTRATLPAGSRLTLGTALEIDLTTLSVSHVIPGGSAAGAGLGYRLLTDQGILGSDAGFALATQGLGSAAVLSVLLWLGLAVSIPLRGFNPLYVTAAIVGIVLIGGFSLGILLLVKGEDRAAGWFHALTRKLPFVNEESLDGLVHHLAERLKELGADRRLLAKAVGWASANWLLDMACLGVFLAAFGHRPPLDGLVVSYGLANVVAAIPITPGGLGILEAVLTSSLVGFGIPRGIAILGVIGYRLVNFWLPIPVGGLSYLALRLRGGTSDQLEARRLRALAEEAAAGRESARVWAQRHGLQAPRTGRGPRRPPPS